MNPQTSHHLLRVGLLVLVAAAITVVLYLLAGDFINNLRLPFETTQQLNLGSLNWLVVGILIFDTLVFAVEAVAQASSR